MNYDEFESYIVDHVAGDWREDLQVEVKEVPKNNGTSRRGLHFSGGPGNIFPVLYFDELYAAYQKGISTREIIDGIREIYDHSPAGFSAEDLDIFNFEKIRDRIIFQLTGYEKNREMLAEIPHVRFLDMAIIFKIAIRCHDPERLATYIIRNKDMEEWGVTTGELYDLAMVNTIEISSLKILNMTEKMVKDMEMEDMETIPPMVLMSNQCLTYGAGVVLYPSFLKAYADGMQSNLYLIPSSIHEVLVLPETDVDDVEQLKNTICEVNKQVLNEADILSDSLYYYNRITDRIDFAYSDKTDD